MGVNLKQGADATLRAVNDLDSVEQFRVGGLPRGSLVAGSASSFSWKMSSVIWQRMALGSGTAVAVQIPNPLGVTCMIANTFVNIIDWSPTTATIDIGTGASASATSDNLIDGLTIGGATTTTGAFSAVNSGGTNGKAAQIWGPTAYVVGRASATATTGVYDVGVAYFPVT